MDATYNLCSTNRNLQRYHSQFLCSLVIHSLTLAFTERWILWLYFCYCWARGGQGMGCFERIGNTHFRKLAIIVRCLMHSTIYLLLDVGFLHKAVIIVECIAMARANNAFSLSLSPVAINIDAASNLNKRGSELVVRCVISHCFILRWRSLS